jgi:hypothetical protein
MSKRWLGKDLPLIRYLKTKNEDISIVSNFNSVHGQLFCTAQIVPNVNGCYQTLLFNK